MKDLLFSSTKMMAMLSRENHGNCCEIQEEEEVVVVVVVVVEVVVDIFFTSRM